jgi:superfamily I DNA/RNA helicase
VAAFNPSITGRFLLSRDRLEFRNVALVLKDDKMLRKIANPPKNDEEKRIAYVALSRAQDRLFIVTPSISENDEIRFRNLNVNIIRTENVTTES